MSFILVEHIVCHIVAIIMATQVLACYTDLAMSNTNIESNIRHNIFHWATKELSQDAVLCWIFAQYNEDNAAGLIARTLIKQIVLGDEQPINVEVNRQWGNIDILLILDYGQHKRAVVIEDKVEADLYNDLERYCNDVQVGQSDTHVVILRTGDGKESQWSEIVSLNEDVSLSYLNRRDLINLMSPYVEDIQESEILRSFYNFLLFKDSQSQYTIDSLRESLTYPFLNHSAQWKKFYNDLYHKIVDGIRVIHKWEYVPNPQGGFMSGMLDSWVCVEIVPFNNVYPIYMQIESGKGCVCLKVGEVEDVQIRQGIRNWVYQAVEEFETIEPSVIWERPARFGSGTYMTVCVLPPEKWLFGTMDDVVARLVACIRWHEKFICFLNEKAKKEKEQLKG